MNRNTKLAAFMPSYAITLFASITAMEQDQRNERLQKLDDEWVRQKISEAFPGFPVITQLRNVTTPWEDIGEGLRWRTFQGGLVERISGQHPPGITVGSLCTSENPAHNTIRQTTTTSHSSPRT